MFYSHEILTSRKYGVATIWLVATLGQRSSLKKISRKAILDVDVPKACESILLPDAPMALRLQSNLLYGVSRVYSQQCGYVLSDAQHAQNSMRALLRVVRTAELDAEVSTARPEQLLLEDDPAFLPDFTLESLYLDLPEFGAPTFRESQISASLSLRSLSGSQLHAPGHGLILPSDTTGDIGGFIVPATGSRVSSRGPQLSSILLRGEEEGLLPEADFAIDAEGNVIEVTPAPGPVVATPAPGSTARQVIDVSGRLELERAGAPLLTAHLPVEFMDVDLLIGDGYDLPEPESVLPSGVHRQPARISPVAMEEEPSSSVTAPLRRRARVPKIIPLDTTMELRNRDLMEWNTNYLNNMAEKNRESLKIRAPIQAKKNAYQWILDGGIANVGRGVDTSSIAAPLSVFHGSRLYEMITGLAMCPTGEKRPLEDTGDETTDLERRVRPRSDDEDEIGRRVGMELGDEGILMLGDDVEIPREGPEGLEDISSAMPWNITASFRGSSVARQPLVSIAAAGPRRRGVSASPLTAPARPSHLQPTISAAEAGEGFTSDQAFAGDLGGPGEFELYGPAAEVDTQTAAQHSWQRDILDQESSNFHDFLEHAVEERRNRMEQGELSMEDYDSIYFEDLLPPSANSRIVAAQALLHVLSLASKNIITATQPEPYGPIELQLVSSTT